MMLDWYRMLGSMNTDSSISTQNVQPTTVRKAFNILRKAYVRLRNSDALNDGCC
jgi:hypothetical protein